MGKYFVIAIMLASLAAAGQPPVEQPPAAPMDNPPAPNRPHGGPDGEMRQLLEQVMIARVSQDLALDNEQTVLLVRRIGEFREALREKNRARKALVKDLDQLLTTAGDTAAIEEQLALLQQHDRKVLEMRQTLFETTSEDLTSWQRAKLYLFLSRFDEDMRRLVMKAKERGQRGKGEAAPAEAARTTPAEPAQKECQQTGSKAPSGQ